MNIKWVEEHEGVVIKVVGVGGAGCNSVGRMVGRVRGVEVVAIDTDHPSLLLANADTKLHIGSEVTHGCGAGGDPEKGRESAERDRERIRQTIVGADLVIVATGLGRGTGTGAAPVVAHLAREVGALTIALVTTPFDFVGSRQLSVAKTGLEHMRSSVDALVSLSSDALLLAASDDATVQDTFLLADSLLVEACEALSEAIQEPGLINLGISDLRAVLEGSGDALLGVGTASGEMSWDDAPRSAVRNPLFSDAGLRGAKAVLASFSVHPSVEVRRVIQAARAVRDEMGEEGDLVLGLLTRPDMDPSSVRVLLVGGGIGSNGSGRKAAVRSENLNAFSVTSDYAVPASDPDDIGVLAKDLFEPAINRLRKQATVADPERVSVGASNDGGDYQSRRGYRLREAE
jgi:cell division protein FtsZ